MLSGYLSKVGPIGLLFLYEIMGGSLSMCKINSSSNLSSMDSGAKVNHFYAFVMKEHLEELCRRPFYCMAYLSVHNLQV